MANRLDINEFIGKKFNRLLLLQELPTIKTSGGNSKRIGSFECDCGVVKSIEIQSVIHNITNSCGCLNKEIATKRAKERNYKHGEAKSSEYNAWRSMKKRCLNPKNFHFKHYGGRGIKISDEWVNSFENFINDMGKKPSKEYSLERLENNGNYTKENCIWATKMQQCQNQRTNKNIDYKGEIKCVSEWARLLNMSHEKLSYRLFKANYSIEKAFTQ